MARIVALAGDDGRSVKESLWLASERTGLCFRRVRAFHQRTADAWAWEADRLRREDRECHAGAQVIGRFSAARMRELSRPDAL
jgi:hypothetical protein